MVILQIMIEQLVLVVIGDSANVEQLVLMVVGGGAGDFFQPHL